ncbi:MAG: hypothetical protein NTY32_02300, partial [Bacteroidia bacterium]|nr:hypothetical protein [Bacteroidia bacterium]
MLKNNDPENSLEKVNVFAYDEAFIQSSIQKRLQATNTDGLETYRLELENNVQERTLFMKSLQVSYSEFFRNPLTFAVLEKLVLPELIQHSIRKNHSKLRIWSMACASGQEVYSLAILLEEYLENEMNPIQYHIFASDHSVSEIEQSMNGTYTLSSLGNVSLNRLNRWFTKEKEGYKIKDEICQKIVVSVFDVVSNEYGSPPESIYGDFDLIICANLLFYYKPEFQNAILEKAVQALSNGG